MAYEGLMHESGYIIQKQAKRPRQKRRTRETCNTHTHRQRIRRRGEGGRRWVSIVERWGSSDYHTRTRE